MQSIVGTCWTGRDETGCWYVQAHFTTEKRIQARFLANALVEKQRIQLVDMHKDGCPWKKRQCGGRFTSRGPCMLISDPFFLSADVYRIPLSSPAIMAKEIKTRARSLEPVLEGVEIKHPLVKLIHPEQASLSDSSFEVLYSSEEPVGDYCVRGSRTFHQRTSGLRDCKGRRTTYHKIVTTPRAISHCHTHCVVRLVSCAFRAPHAPIYNCFSLVTRLFRCSARISRSIISPPDTAAVIRNRY